MLLGPRIWDELHDKVVLDFGCGSGEHAIEIARRGARRVIGLDIRPAALDQARAAARAAGLHNRCVFTTSADEPVDTVISLDAFEHFADPAGVLETMGRLLRPGGRIIVAFGPPWLHPKGGHLFSIFPWAHVVFTERALLRWWADFKTDGATRFAEVEGGLNQMTVARFERLVRASGFSCEHFEAVPIRRLRLLHASLTREFLTTVVRCRLAAPAASGS